MYGWRASSDPASALVLEWQARTQLIKFFKGQDIDDDVSQKPFLVGICVREGLSAGQALLIALLT